jgi:hypothetical protein
MQDLLLMLSFYLLMIHGFPYILISDALSIHLHGCIITFLGLNYMV